MKTLYESIISNSNIGKYKIGNKIKIDDVPCYVFANNGKQIGVISVPCYLEKNKIKFIEDEEWLHIFNDNFKREYRHNIKSAAELEKHLPKGWEIPNIELFWPKIKNETSEQYKKNIGDILYKLENWIFCVINDADKQYKYNIYGPAAGLSRPETVFIIRLIKFFDV